MNRDIRINIDFLDHPKTIRLKKYLGAEGVLCLLNLWMFAAKSRHDGLLTDLDEEDIAIAARWGGDPHEFINTLLNPKIRFLERTPGGILAIHDWIEHNPYAAYAPMRSERARQNILKRWQKKQKTNNTAKPASEADLIQSVLPIDTNGNTPTPTPTPTPIPPSEKLISRYVQLFEAKYGRKPVITHKDFQITKRLKKTMSYHECNVVLERFFKSKDDFIVENCHSLNILESQINKLLNEKPAEEVGPTNMLDILKEERRKDEEALRQKEKIKGESL